MRNKELVSKKIEQVSNALTSLGSTLHRGVPIEDLKNQIERIQERLQEMQTLINTESESWN